METMTHLSAQVAFDRLLAFVSMGGAAMWAIAILSVITVALILTHVAPALGWR